MRRSRQKSVAESPLAHILLAELEAAMKQRKGGTAVVCRLSLAILVRFDERSGAIICVRTLLWWACIRTA